MANPAASPAIPAKFRHYAQTTSPGRTIAPASPSSAPPTRSPAPGVSPRTPARPTTSTPAPRNAGSAIRPGTGSLPAGLTRAVQLRYVMRLRGSEAAHDLDVFWETTRLRAKSKANAALKDLEGAGYTLQKTVDADEAPIPEGMPTIIAWFADPPPGKPARWIEVEAHSVDDIIAFGLASEAEIPLTTAAQRAA